MMNVYHMISRLTHINVIIAICIIFIILIFIRHGESKIWIVWLQGIPGNALIFQ